MVIGLFTEILPPGGVQRAGRHIAAVASQYAADHSLPCRFLSLNDRQGLHPVRVGSQEFHVTGHAHEKSQFVLAALRAAGRKPSIVIAAHPHLAPVVSVMRLRSRRFRSIVLAHGIEVWQPMDWMRRSALISADLVTAPSNDTAQHLIREQGIREERIRRLPWGLDPEFEDRLRTNAHPPRPQAFPEGSRIILTVGRWDPAERYKGADTLICALPRILQSAPGTVLVLVGDGQDRPRLEQLARDSGVTESTIFLHGLTQEELFACYSHCDVFALPSSGEGFGLVFLEAMSHGKPVIGGAHGGTLDVIVDGVTGLLVPHGDVAILSNALKSLLDDPRRAGEMGMEGRRRVETLYTSERFQAGLTQLLEGLV
jgi:glycosyltransferase involved in cell wall biosynthesis